MMPAGRYYVGDLCYVMHPQWDEFCNITISGHQCLDGEFNLANGVRFASYGTAYGDGSYSDREGRNYSVDAGLIGCIRVEDINDPTPGLEGGQIIEFAEPFETSGGRNSENWDGVIRFGNVEIATEFQEEWDQELDD
jgi:hypothetical protein